VQGLLELSRVQTSYSGARLLIQSKEASLHKIKAFKVRAPSVDRSLAFIRKAQDQPNVILGSLTPILAQTGSN
jgi:hypothetical protein